MREVETYGGRVGGVWERWRCVREVDVWEGVKCVEGWRCVGRSEVCGRGGGVF